MNKKKSLTLSQAAQLTGCRLVGKEDHLITGVADLESANSEDASFLSNPRYERAMKNCQAGVIFVAEAFPLVDGKNYLVSPNPSQSFQQIVDYLHPQRQTPSGFKGIHPTAVIHETACIETGVSIGPQSVIDEGVKIGKDSFIGAGSYIGPDVVIGSHCVIHPRVTIREECTIGNRVIIQPGAVIGSCGFGYVTDKQGRHIKLNQVGRVIVEDDVEIGANTTIDRARFKETRIGQGTKIDNLVQIAHAVDLGENNLIAAQTGIAGSTRTGKWVVLAGQVAVAGHLSISDCVTVAGKSGVTKSLFKKGTYGGIPAVPIEEYNRNRVFLRKIEKYIALLTDLQTRFKSLETRILD